MTLMVRISLDMRLLVLPPPISSYSPKFGLELCLITEEPSSTKKKKKENNKQSTQQYIQIKTHRQTKIGLTLLKIGSPVKSPFFCSGENLTSKPWDRLESIFRLKSPPRFIFYKGKGKRK